MVIVALNYFQWSFRGEQLKRIEDFNRYERLRVTQQEYDLLTTHPPYRLNPNIFIAGNMDCLPLYVGLFMIVYSAAADLLAQGGTVMLQPTDWSSWPASMSLMEQVKLPLLSLGQIVDSDVVLV